MLFIKNFSHFFDFISLNFSSLFSFFNIDGESFQKGLKYLSMALVMLPSFGTTIGQGIATAALMKSISRNPESASISSNKWFVGMFFCEAGTIYCLFVVIYLMYAN
jgi:F0F1-type ATP synthase membrane subunit c/vacuolar-type H+-ATPase subunit K